jgi:hypothetical protein
MYNKTYKVNLTPNIINPASEGSLDSSILNGVSLQRTVSMIYANKEVDFSETDIVVGNKKDQETFVAYNLDSIPFIEDATEYEYRVVDRSSVNSEKRVCVFITNIATEFDNEDSILPWQDQILNQNSFKFNFSGSNVIEATVDGVKMKPIVVSNHKLYAVDLTTNSVVEHGASSSASVFGVINTISSDIVVTIKRNGNAIESTTVAPSATKNFRYQSKMRIGVSDNLNEVIPLSEVNTELSTLGIESADIVITGGNGSPYSFTLQNITFA